MNRNPSKKTTTVQAEPPAAAPNEEAPAAPPAAAGPPPLSTGWKLAILVWLLGFFALAAFETFNVVWQLVKG